MIGNPPYITKELTKYHKNVYNFLYQESISDRTNIYNYFINRISGIINEGGMFSFIISNSFITDQFSIKLREFISNTYKIEQILDFLSRTNIFKGILQGTCIFVFKKPHNISELTEYNIKITQTFDSDTLNISEVRTTSISKEQLINNKSKVFLVSPELETYAIIRKVDETTGQIKDIANIIQSGEIRPADSNCRPYFIKGDIADIDQKENLYPVITGKNVNCFVADTSLNRKDPRWYRRPEDKNKLLARDSHSLYPRIILQRISAREQSRRLYAGLIDQRDLEKYERIWVENSGSNYILLKPDSYNSSYHPFLLIALLNSIFINWYIHHMNLTAAVSPSDIERIPIPYLEKGNEDIIETIIDSVRAIMSRTKELNSSEEILHHIFPTTTERTVITDSMDKIDELVFDLYKIPTAHREFILKQVTFHYSSFYKQPIHGI